MAFPLSSCQYCFDDILKKERITPDEDYVAARKKDITGLKNIYAIVLETTVDITVIPKSQVIRQIQ